MKIKECPYEKTCVMKTLNCMELDMTEIHAKPIVDGKFWIVEQDGSRIATLHKKENNKFVLSSHNGELMFNKKDDLTRQFGKGFFLSSDKVKVTNLEPKPLRGVDSNGMVLAANSGENLAILTIDREIAPGTKIK